jgi:hypothetical protein
VRAGLKHILTSLGQQELQEVSARATPATLARHLTADLPPDIRYEKVRHVALIAREFRRVALGKSQRLLLFAPPRHGKSQTVSRWGPVWFFDQFPHKRIMLGSYAADFARDWGRLVRDTIENSSGNLNVRMRDDARRADRWITLHGGGMITGGPGGAFTGRGMHVGICDDVFKNYQDAMSPAVRDRVWNWFKADFITRLEPDAGIIVAGTRWHTDDLFGRILAEPDGGKWRIINLPALAEAGDMLGRAVGEPLWPERYPLENLLDIRGRVGPYVWDSLYQQRPPDMRGSLAYYAFEYSRNVTPNAYLVDGYPIQIRIDFNRIPGMHAVIGQHFGKVDLITSLHVLHAPGMTINRMVGATLRDVPPPPDSFCAYLLKIGAIDKRMGSGNKWHWTGRFPTVEVFGDATGRITQYSDGASSWSYTLRELAAAGIPHTLRLPKENPGVVDRVNATNAAFVGADERIRHIIAPPTAENQIALLIRDYENVMMDGDDIDKSRQQEGWTHSSDANGYAVNYLMPIREQRMAGGRIGTGRS